PRIHRRHSWQEEGRERVLPPGFERRGKGCQDLQKQKRNSVSKLVPRQRVRIGTVMLRGRTYRYKRRVRALSAIRASGPLPRSAMSRLDDPMTSTGATMPNGDDDAKSQVEVRALQTGTTPLRPIGRVFSAK